MKPLPFTSSFTDADLLRLDRPQDVEAFLRSGGWLDWDESVEAVTKAGEGNMNLTLRVAVRSKKNNERWSVVVKQARPWVEKYPSIAAPIERIVFEQKFYQRAMNIGPVWAMMPDLLAVAPERWVLLVEDLGEAADFTSVYQGGSIRRDEIVALAQWCAVLHAETRGEVVASMANRGMRQLNHAYIFDLPLRGGADGVLDMPLDDLEPGLAEAAAALRADADYVEKVRGWGEHYLCDGPCLLHGDYYPGSWLRTEDGAWVIDPEFGFFGEAEFDVGVAMAHLVLGRQPWSMAESWLEAYREAGGQPLAEDALAGYAGAEVMRRVIGLAQLPIPRSSDGRRAAWLEASWRAVMHGELERLWD